MRFGVSMPLEFGDRRDGLATSLERIARLGYDGIELHVGDIFSRKSLREIGQRLFALGLEATVAGDEPAAGSLESHLYALADACTLLDARILCGSFSFASDRQGTEMLTRVATYMGSLGVILALCGRKDRTAGPAPTVMETLRLIDAVGSPNVGILYNTYQAHVEEPSISGALLSAGERLRHVQIADNDGAAPGEGQVRWSETFAALDAIRYDGWYVIQTQLRDDDDALAARGLRFLHRHRPALSTSA